MATGCPAASGLRGRRGKPIVDGATKILLAPDVAFSRLNGCVPQQKLDLFQFTASRMAQAAERRQ